MFASDASEDEIVSRVRRAITPRTRAVGVTWVHSSTGLGPDEVVKRLLAKKILASTSPYAVSYARVSAGIMVQPEEVERAIREIGALAA